MYVFSSNRRDFLKLCGFLAVGAWFPMLITRGCKPNGVGNEVTADIFIAGGGLGGCAAALAATRRGFRVVMAEPTDWIGGQATQQGVSALDDHIWIELFGRTRSYAEFRTRIRDYYRKHYSLTPEAMTRRYFNPGDCLVSKLCFEPKVALAVLQQMLAPAVSTGLLVLLLNTTAQSADVDHDRVRAVQLFNEREGRQIVVWAKYFIDASETGELLPLTGTEWVIGSESKAETQEPHASEKARPHNVEAPTWCCVIDYREGEDHTIERPEQYDFWHSFCPNLYPPWPNCPLFSLWVSQPMTDKPEELSFVPTVGRYAGYRPTTGRYAAGKFGENNLWLYRRIVNQANFRPGFFPSDLSLVNWPQNDYLLGNVFGGTEEENTKHRTGARQLTLSLVYWLQTEAPRPDGKAGWPQVRLCREVLGTDDGLAKFPYIRESRRIKAEFTILEQHVCEQAPEKIGKDIVARGFEDSIGVGHYDMDLHPSTGGDNYLDLPYCPYQIPLGALIPRRMENLIPGCKNIGTTHLSNGSFRLHHTEWNIGEAAGALCAFCLARKEPPRRVRNHKPLLREFQDHLVRDGFELDWSKLATVRT